MRILFLVESLDGPSTRYRVEPLARLAAGRGHGVVIEVAGKGASARRRCHEAARASDLVVVQRRLWPITDVRTLRRAARMLVFDIDDAVCYADGSRGRFRSVGRWLKFRAMCRAADVVTAGNAYLAQLAHRFGARRVERFPTLVADDEVVASSQRASGQPLVAVWLGGASTKRYVHAWLKTLPCGLPARCELRVIADVAHGPEMRGVSYLRYEAQRVGAWLRECHVGLAPLPDDPWTRGKCALKVLQYGAHSLPTVASPVGVQCDLVVDGVTGFLANSPDQWTAALLRCESDEAARRRMGRAAQESVQVGFTWRRWRDPWLRLLEGLGGGA